MYSFKNDYSEGAHPRILEILLKTNLEQTGGYGEDDYCAQAAALLKQIMKREDADVHFLMAGTQTNLVALSAFLRPHEAIIAPCSGHILVHETGAIEATGHKILSCDVADGKLTCDHIQAMLDLHVDEHMVKPRLVFISNSTEIGSIYKKAELEALSTFCREKKLYLYIDGARLGSALNSEENDLTYADLARLADAFYIGGTKNGALFGEALVICREGLKEDFRFHMKQKGALLAKGRLLGLQYLELFRDGLYDQMAAHANRMAMRLRDAAAELGYGFLTHSASNQIFPILPDPVIEKLLENYAFYVWAKDKERQGHSSIRLVTSWATREDQVDAFIEDLKRLS